MVMGLKAPLLVLKNLPMDKAAYRSVTPITFLAICKQTVNGSSLLTIYLMSHFPQGVLYIKLLHDLGLGFAL